MLKLFTRSQKGQSLAFFVLLLPLLLIMPVFVLELGHLYIYQSELQHAADAAALAGVSISTNGALSRSVKDEQIRARAGEIVALNANRTPFTVEVVNDETSANNSGGVHVVLKEEVKPIFVKLFGEKEVITLKVSATADSSGKLTK